MVAWHRARPDDVDALREELQALYPTLHVLEPRDKVVVRGSFPVLDEGKEIDRYKIEIELPDDYPSSLPVVREIGGRIPHQPERHVSGDGTLCVCLPDAHRLAHPRGQTLVEFLRGPLHNYLLGSTVVERGGQWPFGEWAHDVDGVIEFYSDLFALKDTKEIVTYLVCLSRPAKGHWPCPCGSGKRFRYCHRSLLHGLGQKIPPESAQKALADLWRLCEPSRAR